MQIKFVDGVGVDALDGSSEDIEIVVNDDRSRFRRRRRNLAGCNLETGEEIKNVARSEPDLNLFVCLALPVCMSVCLFFFQSDCFSVYLSVFLSVFYLSL